MIGVEFGEVRKVALRGVLEGYFRLEGPVMLGPLFRYDYFRMFGLDDYGRRVCNDFEWNLFVYFTRPGAENIY